MADIDTGDWVLHKESGETWIVARVEGDKLAWLGYPSGWLPLSDFELRRKASDEVRNRDLAELAESRHHCASWARERIKKERAEKPDADLDALEREHFGDFEMKTGIYAPAVEDAAPAASEWDVRGHLAATLTCWHRLTDQEASELVALFQGRLAPGPAAVAVPVAVLRREIGETSWFDHTPVRPNSDEHTALKARSEWDYCEAFAAPTTQAPAVAGPVVAYRISDPNEPELGCWLSEQPGATWCKSEPLVAAAPTQSAPQPEDADGSAFRTAARLGLTLRFYGGVAQSSMPGSPAAYEEVPGQDRAAAMREAIERAASVIAGGGEAQKLAAPQPAAPQPSRDLLNRTAEILTSAALDCVSVRITRKCFALSAELKALATQPQEAAPSQDAERLPGIIKPDNARAAFEAWAPTQHMRTERWAGNPDLYDDEDAISAWQGWEAGVNWATARTQQQEGAPQPAPQQGKKESDCARQSAFADWDEVATWSAARRANQDMEPAPTGLPFGVIDPDYATFYTKARIAAWQYGYALTLHGSFTRDLDLVAVPWADHACGLETLVTAIEYRTGLKRKGPTSDKPHGRQAVSLMFPGFEDPRWVDLSIVPLPAHAQSKDGGAA